MEKSREETLKTIENLTRTYENVNRNICDYLAYIYGLDYKYTPNYSALSELFNGPP